MSEWTITLRGGPWDGWVGPYERAEPILIAWTCRGGVCEWDSLERPCDGHFTMDPEAERIVLERAVAYKRAEVDEREHTALYEAGPDTPGGVEKAEERELVPVGTVSAVSDDGVEIALD